MRLLRRLLSLAASLLAAMAVPAAQGEVYERIEVGVNAVAGGDVFLDAGREAGIEPGDRVQLFPFTGPAVEAVIRDVARSSSRASLLGGGAGVAIGVRGEVLVPAERLRALRRTEEPPPPAADGAPADEGAPAQEPAKPEHPPWEHPPVEWDQEQPLLASVDVVEPEDREPRLHGRFFTQLDQTWDHEGGGREYGLARTGVDLTLDNPFARGGELELDGDLLHRTADTFGAPDETEDIARLDRLSWSVGGLRGDRNRWQAGRFLQHAFPELGVLDGVEYGRRLDSGSLVGASLGFLPEPDDRMRTGDDVQAALFYEYVSDEQEELRAGAAYQKTWHRGEADRDLFVGTAAWRPVPQASILGTAWVDLYTSGDTIKGSGPELTQLQLNAWYRFEGGHRVGAFASHLRWPELLREEFASLTPEQIAANRVRRAGLDGTRVLTDDVRLDGRIDRWEDQDDSGSSGSLRLAVRDWLWERGEVSFGPFFTEGKFSSALGLRLTADRRLDSGFLRASWDVTDFEQEGVVGAQQDLLQHALRGSYDCSPWEGWDLSVYVEQRFGDEQDAQSVGLWLQRRL